MYKRQVVFWSATGNTETMANCVAEGANGTIVPCSEMNAAKLAEFDAVDVYKRQSSGYPAWDGASCCLIFFYGPAALQRGAPHGAKMQSPP